MFRSALGSWRHRSTGLCVSLVVLVLSACASEGSTDDIAEEPITSPTTSSSNSDGSESGTPMPIGLPSSTGGDPTPTGASSQTADAMMPTSSPSSPSSPASPSMAGQTPTTPATTDDNPSTGAGGAGPDVTTGEGGASGGSGAGEGQDVDAGGSMPPGDPTQPQPAVDDDGCPRSLEGWGSVSGDGVQTTTGGGDAAPVRATSASELSGYASDGMPRVIEIEGTINVPRLEIRSNKTLVGVGADAQINGGLVIKGSLQSPVTNVIIRNLNINGASTGGEDAIQVQFAHHVWFDHCNIWDGPDGNLDMTHAVNWSTISWTIFRYTDAYRATPGESGDHRFSNLIGHSDDNGGEDRGKLKITLHHNWWSDGVRERMPRVRFGEVHVFNNYYSSGVSNYCVGAGAEAHILLENNYFDGVRNPHRYINSGDANTAHITSNGNEYSGASGDQVTGGGGQAFTMPGYDVEMDPASEVKDLVRRCSGPR